MIQYFHRRLRRQERMRELRREQLRRFDAWLLGLGGSRLWLFAVGVVLFFGAVVGGFLILSR